MGGSFMDIKQLKYFQAIVEEKNITKAAQRLFMTQSSLSQQVKALETELGVKLFERGSRSVRVTAAGELLQKRSEVILEFLRATSADLKALQNGEEGTLSIGMIASAGVTLLPSFFKKFNEKYPKVTFRCYEGNTQRILDLLNRGMIEIALVRSNFNKMNYVYMTLPSDPMVVVCRKDQESTVLSPIELEYLKNKPLLLHSSNETMIVKSCRRYGFIPNILCRGDDVRSLLVWAEQGLGYAVVPRSALKLIAVSNLQYWEVTDSLLRIERSLIWLEKRALSLPARRFIQLMFPSVKFE